MDPVRTLSSAGSARSVDKRTQLERVEEVREEREREREAWAMDKEANVQLRTALKRKDEEGAGMFLRVEQEREERKERERPAEGELHVKHLSQSYTYALITNAGKTHFVKEKHT